jgi:asparagine synthase (glutamine-hydrolysing)
MNYLSLLNKDLNLINSTNFNDKFIYLNRECNLKHWDSYFDTKNEIQLMILGRPVIEILDWKKFDKFEENYITKFLIKKYIDLELNDFCNQLNGAFSILVIDYKLNKILIITDKLGIYPIYTYGIDSLNSFQFSSNFKILADNISNKLNIDIISIAEFLKKGFIYHPNSFYSEIKTLDNGSYYSLDFDKKKISKKKYYNIIAKPNYDFDHLVNKLSKALLNSIERRTLKYFGKKAVFLSGGSDSRMILSNSADKDTDAVTLYNQENHEIEITKKITKLLDKKHQLIKRDTDYYLNSFNISIQINGGRSLPIDDHFLNLKKNEVVGKYDTILTGCYADWLFKGIALDREQLSIFFKKLPLFKLKSFDYNFFSKRSLLKNKYEEMIKQREDQIFLDKQSHINVEISRLFPLFQEETSATRLTLQQLFPWDSIFSDNDVIEVYQQIPAKYKINSEVYDKAVSLILNKVKNISHANKKHKIGINKYYGALLYTFSIIVNKVLKLMKIKKTDSIFSDGSWINHREYAKTDKIKEMWMNIQNSELFDQLLNDNRIDFKDIIKDDYKLIYKCIVVDKILNRKIDKFNNN